MGAAVVSIGQYNGRKAIVKQGCSLTEMDFYQQVAPRLRSLGVGIPALQHIQWNSRTLVLEYIPEPLSLEELLDDDRALEMLSSIHQTTETANVRCARHQWTSAQTEQALDCLELPADSAAIMRSLQTAGQCLFEPRAMLMGDSNNGNWGKRVDGGLVLFDWERYGAGSPAIDLAPLVQGMGDVEAIATLAERYYRYDSAVSVTELIRQVFLAKAWIVVEVVNILVSRQNWATGKYLSWYNAHLPAWLHKAKTII